MNLPVMGEKVKVVKIGHPWKDHWLEVFNIDFEKNSVSVRVPGLSGGPILFFNEYERKSNSSIKNTFNHANHEIVENWAGGKSFLYCRQCKEEVV